jgi:copper chaperone
VTYCAIYRIVATAMRAQIAQFSQSWQENSNMTPEATYRIAGMTCAGCVRSVTRALRSALPRAEIEVDLDQGMAHVRGEHSEAAVQQAVVQAGFRFDGQL